MALMKGLDEMGEKEHAYIFHVYADMNVPGDRNLIAEYMPHGDIFAKV